jgi:hypothetical protein
MKFNFRRDLNTRTKRALSTIGSTNDDDMGGKDRETDASPVVRYTVLKDLLQLGDVVSSPKHQRMVEETSVLPA